MTNNPKHFLHLTCPKCGFLDVVKHEKAKEWKCPNCEIKNMINNHNPISHDRLIASIQLFYDTLFFTPTEDLSVDDLCELFYNLFQDVLIDLHALQDIEDPQNGTGN
jgi:hypothetical protein